MIAFMPNDNHFTLRQIDQARGELYEIADEIEALKLQIVGLPSRLCQPARPDGDRDGMGADRHDRRTGLAPIVTPEHARHPG